MTESVSETLVCANHPQTPTTLRCNKCSKPICSRCAVRTPVGYRCKECVRGQQQIFETALWYDYVIAAVIAAPLAALGSFVTALGWFFVVFLAPVAGGAIAEIVRWAVRRRRGRYLSLVAAGAFVAGCLPLVFGSLLGLGLGLFSGQARVASGSLWGMISAAIYIFIGASTLYTRLRGISV